MTRQELESLLTAETLSILKKLFRDNQQRMNLFLKVASENFIEADIPLFETFSESAAAGIFIRKRINISESRFEHTIALFFRRMVSHRDPLKTAEIAGIMGSDQYHNAEKIFFMVPVDREAHQIFEDGFIMTGEQDISLLPEYLEFILSEDFIYFRADYRSDLTLYTGLMQRFVNLLLAKKNNTVIISAVRYLLSDFILTLVSRIDVPLKREELLDLIFDVFHHHPNPEIFFLYIKAFCLRYRSVSKENERVTRIQYNRLMEIWNFCLQGDIDGLNDFKEFISDYGNSLDEFELFMWEIVFSLDYQRASRAITVLVSIAFNSLKGFYSNDKAIIKFLVINIIAAIAELDIKNFTSPLYGIALKLFLGLKLNRGFIKRRADFFSWLKTKSSSLRMEMEIIRYMFFEYIYIALKVVPGGNDVKMTKCCDGRHKFFVELIDMLPPDKTRVNEKIFYQAYDKIFLMLRDHIWKDISVKFKDFEYSILEMRGIGESTDTEDEIISSLEKIEVEDLESYARALIVSFRNDPVDLQEAVQPDFWCRVLLSDALPYCQSVLIPVVGTVEIKESEGGAYTNGKIIYLPGHISYFKDKPEPLMDNRNLTIYIGFTLHEAGHLIGGSYHFNLNAYLEKVERPDLLRTIFNFFEDFRIESFLVKIKAHFQIGEIMKVTNEYLSLLNYKKFTSLSFDFLLYIFDEAGGYNSIYKTDPVYIQKMEMIFNSSLNTGRFRGLNELAEYGVSRLENLDVANPLAAIPLSKEFYEIMKHWPETDLLGVADKRGLSEPGINSGSGGSGSGEPLTKEQLDQMYRAYNEDPEKFLRSRGLRSCPSDNQSDSDSGDGTPYDQTSDFIDEILGMSSPDYSISGTIDYSTRTGVDDLTAANQTAARKPEKIDTKKKSGKKTKTDKKSEKKDTDSKDKKDKKFVYSIDSRTGSRTRLSEIKEFKMKHIDRSFMSKFRKWEYITGIVEQQLALILPSIESENEFSSVDGELDIDLLIDVISDKNLMEASPEIFETRDEQKRSLEIAIGLDASGSTAAKINKDMDTILDIEKVFAIIFGRALGYLTDRVNIYAFNSITSTNVYHAETIDAVSSFMPDAANRDGDFIRYITHILKQSNADVKYFFLLSDGQPSADNYDGKNALDDTLIAMRETVSSGIKLIYFNFDFSRREYFDLFQKEATFARYFKSPDEILSVVPAMLRSVADSIK